MKIDLLTMPGCGHCVKAKQIVEKVKADFPEMEVTVHDITENPELAQQYMLMTAPGVVIDGELVFSGGLDEKKLRERLQG